MGDPLALARRPGRRASRITASDLSIREHVTQANYGNAFLLLIGGPIVGFMVESLQRMAAERDRAQRDAAAAAERARLARAVHDGVLQVLGLVQRRGHELGGEAAELGRLAGEQEVALRTLIREQDQVGARRRRPHRPGRRAGPPRDPARRRRRHRRHGRAARPTWPPSWSPWSRACLDNVERHVGPDARAWVLLEGWPDRVEISVRDEGPGIPEGRLERGRGRRPAGRQPVDPRPGRRPRRHGAGSPPAPDGTEWELVVPRMTIHPHATRSPTRTPTRPAGSAAGSAAR